MATYKVIQDIEAEDHILGPLSLRQFIYAIVCVVCLYFCYLVLSRHVAFLVLLFLPPALFTGFFAWPWGRDQPTEVWALAKIRFLFKSRRRVWDQSGVKELVTITAPKKVEEHLTNGLSQNEVSSRLSALANTIDSRGWAIKNVNVNMYGQPSQLSNGASSDRLIDVNSLPQEVPSYDVQASDDILDAQSNPIAQQFDQMINASAQAHRQQIISQLNQSATSAPTPAPTTGTNLPADYWFLNQPVEPPRLGKDDVVFTNSQVVVPNSPTQDAGAVAASPTADEAALTEELKAKSTLPQVSYGHMRTIQPIEVQQAAAKAAQAVGPKVTPQPDPAILNLASNNDLNVATLARQANKAHSSDEPPEDEVVISLH
jgi:hypothetical protein